MIEKLFIKAINNEKGEKMDKLKKSMRMLICFIYIVFYLIMFLVCVNIANTGLSFSSVLFLIFFLIVVWFFIKRREKIKIFLTAHRKVLWVVCITLILVSVAARLAFLAIGDRFYINETLSDAGVHWYGAQQIVENGVVDQEVGEYESIFPYLAPYTTILSISMRFFGKSTVAVLLSNLIFEVISCVALYCLFSSWKRDKRKGMLAATLWAINPLEIVFCGLPLAIVVVNMLMIVSITLIYFYYRTKRLATFLIFATLVGLVLAIGNAFRPIFIILLIAIIVYSLVLILKGGKSIRRELLGVIVICVVYIMAGLIPSFLHTKINPYYSGKKSSAAWSIYVGANYGTNGKWSSSDRDEFFGPVLRDQAKGDVGLAQALILKKGLIRYRDMATEWQLLPHFVNKIGVLFGDVQNSVYDLPYVYNFSKGNILYGFLQNAILIYYYSLIGFLFYYFIVRRRAKRMFCLKKVRFDLFLVILFVGLVVASLFVEVMNRYSLPFIVVLYFITMGKVLTDKK